MPPLESFMTHKLEALIERLEFETRQLDAKLEGVNSERWATKWRMKREELRGLRRQLEDLLERVEGLDP
jgi:predicted RNase H-like nuclease (RuvC/YqgF family)